MRRRGAPAEVRDLTPEDLPACRALAAERGRPDETEWSLLLSVGDGFCCDAPGGGLAGAVVTCGFGGRVAAIGDLVVSPRHAASGVGRLLLERAVAHAGPAVAFIYPTPEGVPLAERLGFWQLGAVARYVGSPAASAPPGGEPNAVRLRPVGGADFPALVAFDEVAFGASRRVLLERLFPLAERACLAVRGGRMAGYGVAWPGADATVVGPIVADDPAAAAALAGWLAAGHPRPVRLDLPTDRPALHAWASSAGLRWEGTAPLMVSGGRPLPGRRDRIQAIADRALG